MVRAVPEIILGGAAFFSRPLHPQDTHGVRAPPTPRTRKCCPTMDQICLDPQDKLPPPHPTPSDMSTKHPPPPTGQKSACGPPPQDNFWNSPNATQSLHELRVWQYDSRHGCWLVFLFSGKNKTTCSFVVVTQAGVEDDIVIILLMWKVSYDCFLSFRTCHVFLHFFT